MTQHHVDQAVERGAIRFFAALDVPDGLVPFATLAVIMAAVFAPILVQVLS